MSTESTGTPYGIKRIGRLELIAERATPANADNIADRLTHLVKTAAARGDRGFHREISHREIAETITTLMDIDDPESRLKMPEAMFDTVTVVEPGRPRRGDIVHDGTLTGLKVEVEDSWQETRVDESALLWSRKLRLTPAGEHAERAVLAPRNYAFGFWGCWQQNDPQWRGRVSAAHAWTAVFEVHGREDIDDPWNLTMRVMLDSRGGRHYADAVIDRAYYGKTALREAIRLCGPPFDPDRPSAA